MTTNHEIGGSSPSGDVCEDGLVGYDDCLTRSRSRVRSSVLVCFEAMAQRQRVGFQTRRLGVQIPLASVLKVLQVRFLFEHQLPAVTAEKRSGAVEARWAHNPKVRGSKPLFAKALLAQLAARRSHNPKVVSSILTEGSFIAPLAQSVAHRSYVPRVGGSSPPWSISPRWRNWIAHQTSNLGVVGSNPTWNKRLVSL